MGKNLLSQYIMPCAHDLSDRLRWKAFILMEAFQTANGLSNRSYRAIWADIDEESPLRKAPL